MVTFSPLISISKLLHDDIETVTLELPSDEDCDASPSEVDPLEVASAEGVSGEPVVGASGADESVPVDGVSAELSPGGVVSPEALLSAGGVSPEGLVEDELDPEEEPSSVDGGESGLEEDVPPSSSFSSPQLKVMYSPLISNNKLPPGTAIMTT
jgi:hypothetical protein